VNLLLDTHAIIWALNEPASLAHGARRRIEDLSNRVFVSSVSTWEMAIKAGTGKLVLPPALDAWLPARLAEARMTELPVQIKHTLAVQQLPPHHNDPFDRLLLAQALVEGLTLVSRDPTIARYGIPLLPC
jgi:PIN domain nuclease of toxin-antitoxin system